MAKANSAAKPTTIAQYLAGLDTEARREVERVRKAINAAAKGAVESFQHGMPYWTRGGGMLCAVAARAGKVTVYVDPPIAERHQAELGRRLAGKSCIHLKPVDDAFLALLARMLR